jgi:hypothetical protein
VGCVLRKIVAKNAKPKTQHPETAGAGDGQDIKDLMVRGAIVE